MRGKKAVLNFMAAILELIIATIASFVVPHIIIHTYGSGVNGLISSITQFLSYIALVESGIGAIGRASLYKPLADNNTELLSGNTKAIENFYRKVAYVFLAYVIALSVIFPLLVNKDFDWLYTVTLIVILAFSVFIQYYYGITYQTVIQADQRKYIPSLLQALTLLVNMILTVLMVKLGASIHVVKIGSSIAFAIRPIILFFYVQSHYNIDKNAKPRNEILKQRWDGLAQHIAFFVHKNTDIAVLTILANLKDVSVYSVYMLAVSGCSKVVNIFSASLEPAFGNMIAKGEKETLKNRVNLCSTVTIQVTVILFSTAALIISPFVVLYTRGVTDTQYLQPVFGVIMLVAEALYCIRLPYQYAVYAAGHFKQTRNGAIVEAIMNIMLSVILVMKYGIIGIAIGTLVSMLYRTIEYIIYYHKHLIQEKKGLYEEIKRAIITTIEIFIIFLISRLIPSASSNSYFRWIISSCLIGCIVLVIVGFISILFYRKMSIEILSFMKKIVHK